MSAARAYDMVVRAIEVGARVDAAAHHASQRQSKPISDKPDLNQFPDLESSDEA
ncbi:hypothetical protein SDJN02_17271, partial [Cucurbita argyrosperma subsp. argyrosperma]